MTDFTTAAADLEADLGRAREAIRQLTDWMGKLQDRVADLEAQVRPKPTPLVSGPPWPATAVLRGSAPVRTANGATTVTLRPRTVDTGASSDGHDVHVILGERLTRYTWSVETMVDEPMLDALTWKLGGMAAFDSTVPGAWDYWPGGNTSARAGAGPTENAMERLVGQADRLEGVAGFGVYATFPVSVATIPAGKDGVMATIGGQDAWVTNGGHTCHWEIPDVRHEAGRWYRHRREVDVKAGTLTHWIDDHPFGLDGLPWPTAGFNRIYISCMIGGNTPDYLPRTPPRTGTLTYSRYELRGAG